MDPYFSIVIPLYNCKDFILETIESVEGQTFTNFELIVIDDHSTDDSFTVAQEYLSGSKMNYKVVRRPGSLPKGVSSCRNYGIELSRGKWICFLDSDDLFDPLKLEVIFNFINQSGGYDVQIIHHGYGIINDQSELIGQNLKGNKPVVSNITQHLLTSNIVCTSTVVLEKSFFMESEGFNIDLNGVEDYFLWLDLSKKAEWLYIPQKLTIYRNRDFSLMRHREYGHYVSQFMRFIKGINKLNHFSNQEKTILYQSKKTDLVNFYLNKSLGYHGSLDVCKGVAKLFWGGYFSLALVIFKKLILSVLGKKLMLRESV